MYAGERLGNLLGLGDSDDDFFYDATSEESPEYSEERESAAQATMNSQDAAIEMRRAQAEYAAGNLSQLRTRYNAAAAKLKSIQSAINKQTAVVNRLNVQYRAQKNSAKRLALQKRIKAEGGKLFTLKRQERTQRAMVQRLGAQVSQLTQTLRTATGLKPSTGGGGGAPGKQGGTPKPGAAAAPAASSWLPLVGIASLFLL